MRATHLFACLVLCICLATAHAAITVGTCKSLKNPYTTISAALADAPANSVINVCPGTYQEQLNITKAVTINGIVTDHQPGVTITAPPGGIVPDSDNNQSFTEINVKNAGGPVFLRDLTISGGDLLTFEGATNLGFACEFLQIQDFTAVRVWNTPAWLDHLNIDGVFGSSTSGNCGGPGCLPPDPDFIPNCGSGIVIGNQPGTLSVVRRTVVSQAGLFGILATGDVELDHNVVSVLGPDSVGIYGEGLIQDNTVTASTYFGSTGIQGGHRVQDNTIQSGTYGIKGATTAIHNTLMNNSVGIVGNNATENLIVSGPLYLDPSCPVNPSNPSIQTCPIPTVGIELACGPVNTVTHNSIGGVGVGLADVGSSGIIPMSNSFTQVSTRSTRCPKSTVK